MALGVTGQGAPAGAAKIEPPTTVVQATGAALQRDAGPLSEAARDAVMSVWPSAHVESTVDVEDATRSRVDIVAALGDARITATAYRHFDRVELDAAGLDRLPSELGTSWVGVDDEHLTSIYHLSAEGVGVRVGVEGARGTSAPSVAEVHTQAEAFAAQPSTIALAEGVIR